jgi:hypothetical protein
MGPIPNRGLQGQPILPYPSFQSYAGADAFLDLIFVDHTMTPVVPSSFMYQLDDLTNDINMILPTTVTTGFPAAGTVYVLQLLATKMQMTFPYQGSQLCQLSGQFVATDSVTGNPFTATFVYIIELCAIQTPNAM